MLIISIRRWFKHNPSRPDEGYKQHNKGKAEHGEVFT